MAAPRLFVALPLGGEALSNATELLQKAPLLDEIKWSRVEQLHLTLLFLGATPEERIPALIAALKELTDQNQAFDLFLEGWGAFPDRARPKVLFAKVGGNLGSLNTLALGLRKGLGSFSGPKTESSSFQAHVTLGRVREKKMATSAVRFLETESDLLQGGFWAGSLILFESVLEPKGARYIERASFSLRDR